MPNLVPQVCELDPYAYLHPRANQARTLSPKIAISVVVELARFSLELETGCATTVARSDGARDQIRRTGNWPLHTPFKANNHY